jgi:hypothetical protein
MQHLHRILLVSALAASSAQAQYNIAPGTIYDPGMTFAPPSQPAPPPSARRVPVSPGSGAADSGSLYAISCVVTGDCGGVDPAAAYQWVGGWGAKGWGSNNPSILTKVDGSPAFRGNSTSIDVLPGSQAGTYGAHVVMQSFTALDSGALTNFAVYVEEGRNAVAPVSWRVMAGEPLAPVNGSFLMGAEHFQAANGWNEVAAQSNISMTAGQTYTLVLGFDGASASSNVLFGTVIAPQTGDFYQSGRLYRQSYSDAGVGSFAAQEIVYPGGIYDPLTQPDPYRQDLLFAFSVTAVPEPEPFALMLAGLGVVFIVANRGRKSLRITRSQVC